MFREILIETGKGERYLFPVINQDPARKAKSMPRLFSRGYETQGIGYKGVRIAERIFWMEEAS